MISFDDPRLDPKSPEFNTAVVQIKEKECVAVDPSVIIRMHHLKIKTKRAELTALVPNPVQMQVLNKIRELFKKGKPVRLCILKGRQFGISTLLEAIIYSYTTTWPNLNALIMSDDDDGSNYLFEMTKLYYTMMKAEHPHLTPDKRISNEKKLEFMHKRSQILIDTAQNVDAGRKYTFHMAHLSEAARFRDFNTTLLSLMQSVPDYPRTFVAIETTANGDNDFARFWWDIKSQHEKGTTDWVPIFLSWRDHPEYKKDFYTESERETFQKTMSEDEISIMKVHDMTLEQMNWRRWTIVNKCQNRVDLFRQEYPLDDEEAFITSGKRVYGDQYTKTQEKNICLPKVVGDVAVVEKRPTIIPNSNGFLRVYVMPKKGHRYVIGADASSGMEGGDFSCAQVIDRTTWEQVAVLHGRIPPDTFGQELFNLGMWYNWGLMAPESNRDGLVTVLKLRDLFYPNIVHRTKLNFDDVYAIKESTELGWETNVKTKPILISDLRDVLTDMMMVIHDDDTLREVKKYSVLEQSESGYNVYGAPKGGHDDRVIALAIAAHYAKTLPEAVNQSYQAPEIHSERRSGY